MKRSMYLLFLMVWFAGGCAGLFTGAGGSGDHTVPGRKSAEAIKLMEDYKYPESIAAFQKIVEEYPKSDWEANSIYSIATAYVAAENPHKDYGQALIHFEKFLSLYPKHERAADARNWRQAVKAIIDSKKENERLLKNIEKLKQLDMRQEQKRQVK